MALNAAPQMPPHLKFFGGEISSFGQCGVEDSTGVAFAEDEAVPRFPIRLRRIDVHLMEIKSRHDLGARKRTSGMSLPSSRYHLQRLNAKLTSEGIESIDNLRCMCVRDHRLKQTSLDHLIGNRQEIVAQQKHGFKRILAMKNRLCYHGVLDVRPDQHQGRYLRHGRPPA